MIIHLYAYKDKNLGCYTAPIPYEDEPEKLCTKIKRSVFSTSETKLAGKILVYLGSYDDETAEFAELSPFEVLDIDKILAERKKRDEE